MTLPGNDRIPDPEGKQSHSGFGNLENGLKYQVFTSDVHETILSAGLGLEIGGTGRRAVEAESFPDASGSGSRARSSRDESPGA